MEAVVDLKYHPVFPNGGGMAAAAKKARLGAAPATLAGGVAGVYRECLKNHAATLGGHALDGCGEFMPSPEADPADPSSLRCAACGCHRNFHRRLLGPPPPPPLLALPPPPPPLEPAQAAPQAVASHVMRDGLAAPPPAVASHVTRDGRTMMRGEEAPPDDRLPAAFDEETEESDDGSDFDEDRPLSPLPAPAMAPHGYRHHANAPHMLLALSTGRPSPDVQLQTPAAAPRPPPPPPASSLGPMPSPAPGAVPPGASASAARKRVRTKFSPEQKQRMQALSERLGWRLQKRDEAVVDECCREMGVTKGVFKVWMHNNKHNFVGGHSARRSAASASASAAAASAAIHYPSDAAAGAVVYPSSSHAAAAPAPSAAVLHPSSARAAAAARAAPVHADFNVNGTAADAADYFRVQASAASGGSPQSS